MGTLTAYQPKKHLLGRGVGMLAGVELVRDKADRSRWDDRSTAGSMTRDACMRNGIVSRAVGDTMVMAPPLVTELQDIDLMIERLGQSIDEAYQGLRAS